tara:strand:- start:64 stop:861 length:798 start_codon:yes stop_codon:yes gene_type:complete
MTSLQSITVKRLIKDVKFLMNNPLDSEKIFYHHDEDNILLGYALIIGPENTPYENGNYLFKFIFPENYPFSPPKVEYYSNDGRTRFNPNLYINKYVCLSLLNTWRGEGWTSCQSIYSVLLTIQSILSENPLTNEPGFTINHRDVKSYNKIIKYKNFEFTILKFVKYIIYSFIKLKKYNDEKILNYDLANLEFLKLYSYFFKNILENFNSNIDNFNKQLDDELYENKSISCNTYSLSTKVIDKQILQNKMNKYKSLIEKYNIIENL